MDRLELVFISRAKTAVSVAIFLWRDEPPVGNDLVATRGDEPPLVVIGELKLSFSLDLVLQARRSHGGM
jgi:hypothetical protein